MVNPLYNSWAGRLTKKSGIKKSDDILKGNSLEIYRILLRSKKPLGVREIQRKLNLSSPSVVQWHLSKLEEAGLVKHEMGNYTVNRIMLDNCIKVSRFIVPKYLFYSLLMVLLLIIELVPFRPAILTSQYFFAIIAILIAAVIFCYETVKVWIKGQL